MTIQLSYKAFTVFLISTFFVLCFSGFKHLQVSSSQTIELLRLVNEARAQTQVCGSEALAPVAPLTLNEQLNQAAQGHSNDMATNNFLAHTGSNGSSFNQRIEAQGYIFSFAGENVAAGKSTAQETMQQWLNSEGHCRNIMNPNFTQMGVGFAENSASQYRVYWTQVFGTPFGSSAANSNVVISSPSSTALANPNSTALKNSPNTSLTPIPAPVTTLESLDDTGANKSIVTETTVTVTTDNQAATSQAATSQVSNQDLVDNSNFATELLMLINQARAQSQTCGNEVFPTVPALTLNDSLMKAAQGHSSSMAENNFFGQAGLDGKNFDKRAEAQGYSFSFIAENIIAGRPTVLDVMASLLETDGYCRGLMSEDYTELGIGFGQNPDSQYRYYWTLTFAKPL